MWDHFYLTETVWTNLRSYFGFSFPLAAARLFRRQILDTVWGFFHPLGYILVGSHTSDTLEEFHWSPPDSLSKTFIGALNRFYMSESIVSDRAYYTACEHSCIMCSVALEELCQVKYITWVMCGLSKAFYLATLVVHHFGPDWNISTAFGWIFMKFSAEIHTGYILPLVIP